MLTSDTEMRPLQGLTSPPSNISSAIPSPAVEQNSAPPHGPSAAAAAQPSSKAQPPGDSASRNVLRKIRNAFVGTTSGTVLLARHMQDVIRTDLHIDLNVRQYPAEVTRSLRSVEDLTAYLRWLRGVLSVLGVASFILSLLVIEMDEARLSWSILLISGVAEVLLLRIYMVKAVIAGLTSIIYRDKATLWFSPYFYQMLGEMLLWLVQCPPTMESVSPVNMLGFVVMLRIYTLVMYLNNATLVYRTFCRAMSVLVGVPLSNSFFLRTSLIYYRAKTGLIITTSMWLTLALAFSKSEGISYRDAMWFVFVTVGTIGYGDISPRTVIGRFCAFLMWIFALILIGYMVVLTHDTINLKEHERNLFILFRSNQLGAVYRDKAALLIQHCWRFYVAKRSDAFVMERTYLAWSVAEKSQDFKETRCALRAAAATFQVMTEALEEDDTAPQFVPPSLARGRRARLSMSRLSPTVPAPPPRREDAAPTSPTSNLATTVTDDSVNEYLQVLEAKVNRLQTLVALLSDPGRSNGASH